MYNCRLFCNIYKLLITTKSGVMLDNFAPIKNLKTRYKLFALSSLFLLLHVLSSDFLSDRLFIPHRRCP